ncbi:MAG: hypothetical protein GX631_06210, partial [Dehalococcoidales bacterium]|nr:hypothetical protein [Dehalococcoidales bacterium]
PDDLDPTGTVLKEIRKYNNEVDSAVVRLQITMTEELEGQLRDAEIHDALKEAYYATVAKDVERETRIRLGQATVEEIAPLEALKTYLEVNYEPERAAVLLEYGEKLLNEENE